MAHEEIIKQLGATDLLTLTQTLNKIVEQHEDAKLDAWRLRMPNTEYKRGDKVIVPGVGNFDKILRCEVAGVTADTAFPANYDDLEVGNVVQDGTIAWGVVDLVTMPDIEGAPVISVNGKTGNVNLTAQNVGADPAGTAKQAVANHEAIKASTAKSGHVQIDGETIVAEDGVIKAVGGMAIGSIFPFPASVPPEGAYLLNGQSIANCRELYPKFWEWLNSAGVRIIDNDTYEAELASTGVCGGFVVDISAGNVRLPKWKYQAPFGETIPVRGNGTVLGLTNGTETAGLTRRGSTGAYLNGDQDMYGDSVEKLQVDAANEFYGKIGVTTDPGNSGIVAENNAPVDHFVWCIQVFNAATALSEQESAQLASQMQTKAQTDFGNVAENLDFIIKHEEAPDGSWRYDLYRSGKVEQGGIITDAIGSAARTLTLPVEMANSNFLVFTTNLSYNSAILCCPERNETSFQYRINTNISDTVFAWVAKGYAATE